MAITMPFLIDVSPDTVWIRLQEGKWNMSTCKRLAEVICGGEKLTVSEVIVLGTAISNSPLVVGLVEVGAGMLH
jgi:hypothetical protein